MKFDRDEEMDSTQWSLKMSREISKSILEFLSKYFRTIRLIDSYILIGLLSVVWWFCDFVPMNLPINMAGFVVQTSVLHHWLWLPAASVSCVASSWPYYACLHSRWHSSALWQLCRVIQPWKGCCCSARSTFTSVSALCYPLRRKSTVLVTACPGESFFPSFQTSAWLASVLAHGYLEFP